MRELSLRAGPGSGSGPCPCEHAGSDIGARKHTRTGTDICRTDAGTRAGAGYSRAHVGPARRRQAVAPPPRLGAGRAHRVRRSVAAHHLVHKSLLGDRRRRAALRRIPRAIVPRASPINCATRALMIAFPSVLRLYNMYCPWSNSLRRNECAGDFYYSVTV